MTGVAQYTPSTIADPTKEAAVLAPIIDPDGEPTILFTKRSEQLGDHPGQMSFPGGGHEPADTDLTATALREADEEINLPPNDPEIVGHIDDIETVTQYIVRPFVCRIPDQRYTPDEYEVAEIVRLPVAELIDRTNYESEHRDHPHYGPIRIHFFHVGDYTVWGATGRMLAQLLELTTDWEVPPEADRTVDADADLPV